MIFLFWEWKNTSKMYIEHQSTPIFPQPTSQDPSYANEEYICLPLQSFLPDSYQVKSNLYCVLTHYWFSFFQWKDSTKIYIEHQSIPVFPQPNLQSPSYTNEEYICSPLQSFVLDSYHVMSNFCCVLTHYWFSFFQWKNSTKMYIEHQSTPVFPQPT